jgi:hypothetical protein
VLKILDARSEQEVVNSNPEANSEGSTLKVNVAMTGIGLCIVDRAPKSLAYLTLQSLYSNLCFVHPCQPWLWNTSYLRPWNP